MTNPRPQSIILFSGTFEIEKVARILKKFGVRDTSECIECILEIIRNSK